MDCHVALLQESGYEAFEVISTAYETHPQALGAWLMLCNLYHLREVSPTSIRPLCIMNRPLPSNPTDDAFHAVCAHMQCVVH